MLIRYKIINFVCTAKVLNKLLFDYERKLKIKKIRLWIPTIGEHET